MTATAAPPTPIQNTIPSSKLESSATREPRIWCREPCNEGIKNLVQRAITQTFQSTAHLANLLPTGTVLAFQLLSPIFSNQGSCDPDTRSMTAGLVGLCRLSCILSSFTDSFREKDGNVCYGLATVNGLWVIDGSSSLPPEAEARYRLKGMDFVHGVLSLLVFATIALFDENVVSCFYQEPSKECWEVLTALPVGFGAVCSISVCCVSD
ncbi:unnamed protein product [Linum trigynum]|uniref:Uncharacterized protein n=1 Tax=Linum trigynum TaxID=586398 RepID=A0AAV2DG18_9ROSI